MTITSTTTVPDTKTADAATSQTATPVVEAVKPKLTLLADEPAVEAIAATTAETVKPVEYALKAPDKSPLTADDIKATAEQAKSLGLTQEQAQKLVDHKSSEYQRLMQSQQAAQTEAITKTSDQWRNEFETDKEFGGQNLKTSIDNARRFIRAHADDAWAQKLMASPLANEPGFLRMLARAGAKMREDTATTSSSATAESPVRPQDRLYPTFSPKS